jgi:gluconate 5-dehydrogenase
MEAKSDGFFDLTGKVALITGAARGFGRFFSTVFAEAGANLVCSDTNVRDLEETGEFLKKRGFRCLTLKSDVSCAEDVRKLIKEAVICYKRLDIAVNNAGIVTKPYRFHDIPLDDWQRLLAIDLTGVFLCMQEELRAMVEQKFGTIVNIASVAGLRGVSPEFMPRANYVAAKHGVVGLTKQAALEYATENIRINAIAPGWISGTDIGGVRTEGRDDVDSQLKKIRNDFIPLKRSGKLEELKGLLLYLASDASRYVTGQVIAIDGGITAR